MRSVKMAGKACGAARRNCSIHCCRYAEPASSHRACAVISARSRSGPSSPNSSWGERPDTSRYWPPLPLTFCGGSLKMSCAWVRYQRVVLRLRVVSSLAEP